MAAPRRKSTESPALAVSPDTEAVLLRYKREQPEIGQQLEHFFDLFRGIGVPMSFAPESLLALDEAFTSLAEQIADEAESDEAANDDLMVLIQLCGFYWGALVIELVGGEWGYDEEEGSQVLGAPGIDRPVSVFDPFIQKAQNHKFSLVKEFERLTGVKVGMAEG
ncbi:MAG TPA: hypothetical protein VEI97_04110 [bacterium]|nr:hypothetical protein [bacterium]